jgi:hypothetical protein
VVDEANPAGADRDGAPEQTPVAASASVLVADPPATGDAPAEGSATPAGESAASSLTEQIAALDDAGLQDLLTQAPSLGAAVESRVGVESHNAAQRAEKERRSRTATTEGYSTEVGGILGKHGLSADLHAALTEDLQGLNSLAVDGAIASVAGNWTDYFKDLELDEQGQDAVNAAIGVSDTGAPEIDWPAYLEAFTSGLARTAAYGLNFEDIPAESELGKTTRAWADATVSRELKAQGVTASTKTAPAGTPETPAGGEPTTLTREQLKEMSTSQVREADPAAVAAALAS